MATLDHPLASWAVALGIGLLIGIERERRKGEGADRGAAGLRTFTIAALLGAAAMKSGGLVLLTAAVASLSALVTVAYYRSRSDDPGLTTEVALVMTPVLGGLATQEPVMAAALGVSVAGLLAARTSMHRFARETLSPSEVSSGLVLAAATLIVLPLLPDHPVGPFGAVNPRSLWTVAILIMAISAAGHVAVRALGSRYGLPIAGFASGFVSSSATIASMGAKAAQQSHLSQPAVAGAVFSTIATIVQTAVIITAISPVTLRALAWPLASAGTAAIIYGLIFAVRLGDGHGDDTRDSGAAFDFKTVATLCITLFIVLIAVAAVHAWLGERGLVLATAIAGFADAHAPAVSVASQVAAGGLSAPAAIVPILVALSTNTITKIVLAAMCGSGAFAWRVIPGLLAVLAAAWLGHFATRV